MNRFGVAYLTKTKHSKKLAQAVASALGVTAENILDKPAVSAELLFLAGGIYGGRSLPEMLEFVKSLNAEEVKKVALITSSVSGKNGQDDVRGLLAEKGIPVVDEFHCPGSFLFMKMGRPNKADLENAAAFALHISGVRG